MIELADVGVLISFILVMTLVVIFLMFVDWLLRKLRVSAHANLTILLAVALICVFAVLRYFGIFGIYG